VEVGTDRRCVAEVASQLNRPSPVSYLCSVDIARTVVAVSSYKRNPTGSGNRRQVATRSGSNLTIRWVDPGLLLVFHRHFSSGCHRFRVICAIRSYENRPEAETAVRRLHMAEVT
jgi:hypothetical protein